jgi:hypothetical protein
MSELTNPTGTMALSADGNTLATSNFTVARLLDLTALNHLRAHPSERACAITGRGLNHDEWVSSMPGLPYENTCP